MAQARFGYAGAQRGAGVDGRGDLTIADGQREAGYYGEEVLLGVMSSSMSCTHRGWGGEQAPHTRHDRVCDGRDIGGTRARVPPCVSSQSAAELVTTGAKPVPVSTLGGVCTPPSRWPAPPTTMRSCLPRVHEGGHAFLLEAARGGDGHRNGSPQRRWTPTARCSARARTSPLTRRQRAAHRRRCRRVHCMELRSLTIPAGSVSTRLRARAHMMTAPWPWRRIPLLA